MSERITLMAFQEGRIEDLVVKYYPRIRNWYLEVAEENIDDFDIENVELLDNLLELSSINILNEEMITRLVICFYEYLELGNSKIKRQYYSSFSSKEFSKYSKVINEVGSERLRMNWQFLTKGRSLKSSSPNLSMIKNELDFKIGYFSKKEAIEFSKDLDTIVHEKISGARLKKLIDELKEISIKYGQVIVQIA